MVIVIPFYVNELNTKTHNNIKLYLTCINSYYYHNNKYDLEVVTNSDYVISVTKELTDKIFIRKVDDSFFKVINSDNIDNSLENLQTSVKISTIYNYSIENPNTNLVLMDIDMLFLSQIDIDSYIETNEHFTMFQDVSVDTCKKTIKEMLDDSSVYKNPDLYWMNSGIFIFKNTHLIIDSNRDLLTEELSRHSDEMFFNLLRERIESLRNIESDIINIYPVRGGGLVDKGIVHFFNPFFKPYLVSLDSNKELQIGITTDHSLDYIPTNYLEELLSNRKYINMFFIHNCFEWWYQYGLVVGTIGDKYTDFKYFDAEYFKHMIEKHFK